MPKTQELSGNIGDYMNMYDLLMLLLIIAFILISLPILLI